MSNICPPIWSCCAPTPTISPDKLPMGTYTMTLANIRTWYFLATRMNHRRSTVNYVEVFTLHRSDLPSIKATTNK
jgi:hypothetical protein